MLEELDAYEESVLDQVTVDQVLTVICLSMAPTSAEQIQQAAVLAMHNALPFVAANFDDARRAERNSIMTAVCTATQAPSQPVKEYAFQCIECVWWRARSREPARECKTLNSAPTPRALQKNRRALL